MKTKLRLHVLILCIVLLLLTWNVFRRRHHLLELTFPSLVNSSKSIQSRGTAHDHDSSTTLYPTTSIHHMSSKPEDTSLSKRNSDQPTTVSNPPSSCAGGWEFQSSSTVSPVTNSSKTFASLNSLNRSKVICGSFSARLGNQMFQYASLLGIALKTNRIPVFLKTSSLLYDVLRNTSIIDNSVKYSNQCHENFIREPVCCKFFPRFFELDPNKNYTIGKFLQSWRYFFEHEAEIREALKFKDSVVSQARKVVDSLRQKYNRTLTGVHVRRGDYLTNVKGYKAAPLEYLLHAMDYVRKRFGDVTFVVSSNDVTWCQEQFANTSDVTVLSANSTPAVDMMTLASLDHMIMTVGTYGWWASFLNPGVTVYYRDFVDPGTPLSKQFSPSGTDHYCPVWNSLS
ncbi:hypothetical protein C0Q70_18735 [Pomacea canaliculata]|uniref:L-Fucosyltransferase n=1 Tax=Pomacea canaliculata TaxID=400727 RepID=A0A2T7NHC1_POMCA|nr:galactoside 2-alpha-L-fucosyltransferase 2-like [Pomacea canaliculata]PVD20579.1 hypothetical protein C0Q70_18735 [Pomacea canaliculata]